MKLTTQLRASLLALGLLAVTGEIIGRAELITAELDGSVVNKAGIVRGASQRLVKLELDGQPNDELIQTLDGLVAGLINGDPDLDLPPATNPDFIEKMGIVEADWTSLKTLIAQFRANPQTRPQLLTASENFFEVTNDSVFAAEAFARGNIVAGENLALIFIVVDLIVLGFTFFLIQRAISLLQNSVNTITNVSSEIATTVEEQERIFSEQAASVTQTTATIEQLGTSTLQAAAQADSSAEGARQALEISGSGTVTVDQTMEGTTELRQKVEAIANQIMQLSDQTNQISVISDLVADLANQTNMLSLNAAVEAARAGEQGRGFAVVAGEIRKLADLSKNSADKINTLVTDIQTSINSTVMVTDEGTKTAAQGLQLAEKTSA
ncbi:MAG: methyl-accepting chemotaxis protein, partial [Cyanobacteria bacterium P01_H01_bin.121]